MVNCLDCDLDCDQDDNEEEEQNDTPKVIRGSYSFKTRDLLMEKMELNFCIAFF
jgi:hypothetical protein